MDQQLIEKVMKQVMYDVPSQKGITGCVITRDAVKGTADPVLKNESAVKGMN